MTFRAPLRLALAATVLASLVACSGNGNNPGTDSGIRTDGGSNTDSGTGSGDGGPCGLPVATNTTRDTALTYTPDAGVLGCVATTTSQAWYQLTTPADSSGGYVQMSISNVGPGNLQVYVYTAADNGQIVTDYATTQGQSLSLYFAAAPATTYKFAVQDSAGFNNPYRYTFAATYTRIPDAFDPSSSSAPKPITVGVPVNAYFNAGYALATIPAAAWDDFYTLGLTDAGVTVKLENVPTDIAPELRLIDANGVVIDDQYTTTAGQSVFIPATGAAQLVLANSGPYKVQVLLFASNPPNEGNGVVLPDHFTRPYRLTVTQP